MSSFAVLLAPLTLMYIRLMYTSDTEVQRASSIQKVDMRLSAE
jgi:hypothetical protein